MNYLKHIWGYLLCMEQRWTCLMQSLNSLGESQRVLHGRKLELASSNWLVATRNQEIQGFHVSQLITGLMPSWWLPGWTGDMGNWHPRVWRLSWLTIAITTKARNSMTFERGVYLKSGGKLRFFHGCMVDICHGHMRHVTWTGHASFSQRLTVFFRSVARGITSKSLQNRYLHILESVPHSWSLLLMVPCNEGMMRNDGLMIVETQRVFVTLCYRIWDISTFWSVQNSNNHSIHSKLYIVH